MDNICHNGVSLRKELRKLALLKSVKRGRKTRMVLRSVTGHQIANHGIATLAVNRKKPTYNERARSIMKEGKSQAGIVRSENTAKSQSKQKPSRAVKKGE